MEHSDPAHRSVVVVAVGAVRGDAAGGDDDDDDDDDDGGGDAAAASAHLHSRAVPDSQWFTTLSLQRHGPGWSVCY
jgi:hypothetical protein